MLHSGHRTGFLSKPYNAVVIKELWVIVDVTLGEAL